MHQATLELEIHDDNSFHTTYRVEKYLEYAQRLESAVCSAVRKSEACGRLHFSVRKNPGPAKGCRQFQNCRGWYRSPKPSGVPQDGNGPVRGTLFRYPRLGAFEVHVKCGSSLVQDCSGLPASFQVWSKIKSHLWPDVDRLAEDVAKILEQALDQQNVAELVKGLQAKAEGGGGGAAEDEEQDVCDLGRRDDADATSNRSLLMFQPRMYFGMSPRRSRDPCQPTYKPGPMPKVPSRSLELQRPMSARMSRPAQDVAEAKARQRPQSARGPRRPSSPPSGQTTWGGQAPTADMWIQSQVASPRPASTPQSPTASSWLAAGAPAAEPEATSPGAAAVKPAPLAPAPERPSVPHEGAGRPEDDSEEDSDPEWEEALCARIDGVYHYAESVEVVRTQARSPGAATPAPEPPLSASPSRTRPAPHPRRPLISTAASVAPPKAAVHEEDDFEEDDVDAEREEALLC